MEAPASSFSSLRSQSSNATAGYVVGTYVSLLLLFLIDVSQSYTSEEPVWNIAGYSS